MGFGNELDFEYLDGSTMIVLYAIFVLENVRNWYGKQEGYTIIYEWTKENFFNKLMILREKIFFFFFLKSK